MDQMRMDPKHQFAAQYVLQRAATERREREALLAAAMSAGMSAWGMGSMGGMSGMGSMGGDRKGPPPSIFISWGVEILVEASEWMGLPVIPIPIPIPIQIPIRIPVQIPIQIPDQTNGTHA